MSEDGSGGMNRLAGEAAETTNAQLADAEARVLAATGVNLNALRPKVSDKAAFDLLVKAVNESTAKNESIAQLQARITTLGKGAAAVAKEAARLLRPL